MAKTIAKKTTAPAPAAPKPEAAPLAAEPVPDGTKVYLEGIQDEAGEFHPVYVDDHPRSFFVTVGTRRYCHTREHADGTWIYREER